MKKYESFFGENYHFMWSDGWIIDKDNIWFVAGAVNVLFCFNKELKRFTLVERIPSGRICEMRLHPKCIKHNNYFFCLPDRGQDIWRFCLNNHSWKRISVKNPDMKRIRCSEAWIIQDKLYIVSVGLKQILELNIKSNYVEKYYNLVTNGKMSISGSILINNCIYIAESFPARIYKFDCLSKALQIFELTEISDQLETISYDGEYFWLGTSHKKIYLWKVGEKLIILDDFPTEVGIYNFNGKYNKFLNYDGKIIDAHWFCKSLFVDSYMWFIPYHANEILYVNIDTLKINRFPLIEEIQTEEDIEKQLLQHKYLLQYVKEERYIGLFSLKNKWVFEIDCKELKYKIFDYQLNTEVLEHIDEQIVIDFFDQSYIKFENEESNLKSLIQYFSVKKQDDEILGKKGNAKGIIGQNIFNASI